MRSLVLFAVVVVMGTGCLTLNPAGNVRATGQALSVEERGGNVALYQGRQRIDEQDFYAIAGDTSAKRQIEAHRNELVSTQIIGQAAGAGGIGAVAFGGLMLAGGIIITTTTGPIGLTLLIPGSLILVGGIVAIPLGYAMAARAADELAYSSVTLLLPPDRARAAADKYNGRRRRGR